MSSYANRFDAANAEKAAAALKAVYRQIAACEQWSAAALEAAQLDQLGGLVDHAWHAIPFYRDRLEAAGIAPGEAVALADWRRLPLLTRRDIQDAGDALVCDVVPEGHGEIITTTTSGSTGTPVTVAGTILDAYFAKAFALRHFHWHPFDFRRKKATIQSMGKDVADYPDGVTTDRWGEAGAFPFPTGPAAGLDIMTSIDDQLEWLRRTDPSYLATYPTNLGALVERSAELGIKFPRLRHVSTTGEALDPYVREACLRHWGVLVYDIYSAMEVGVLALQCPRHEHYHLMAENAVIEIIGDNGAPCSAGEVGRVVVTPLRNFAMPLLRYEIGDYAEVGAPCDCGRALPVVTRILGRQRNMLVTPDGAKYFPFFGANRFTEIAPVIQHRFIQTAPDRLEAQFVARRPLTGDEQEKLRQRILRRMPYNFAIDITMVDEIPRSAGGKYEEFRCEIGA